MVLIKISKIQKESKIFPMNKVSWEDGNSTKEGIVKTLLDSRAFVRLSDGSFHLISMDKLRNIK